MKAFFREILVTLAVAIVIFLLLQSTIQSIEVHLSSMEPSLHEGQRVLVSKIVYGFHEPERGDVIVFHAPLDPGQDYIKRIIGLPNETVEVENGVVYISDGDKRYQLHESYVKELPEYSLSPQEIPENEYFVLGDNRNNSNDSHRGWTVPRQDIIGKAWLSIWPPGEWGTVADYTPATVVSQQNRRIEWALARGETWSER